MRSFNLKEMLLLSVRKLKIPIEEGGKAYRVVFNVYHLIARIKNFIKYGDPYFFTNVVIETSTYCNRTCYYCPNSTNKTPKEFMDDGLFKKAVDRLREAKFDGILTFSFYNEPLLDKRLPDLVRCVKANLPKCIVRIFSNGDFLSTKLADELVEAGAADFIITIHNKKQEPFLKHIKPVVDKYPHHIVIQSLHGQALYNRGGTVDVENNDMAKKGCLFLTQLVIDYRGNVLLCCNDYHRKYIFGNINDKNLEEIWKSKKFQKIHSDLRKGVTSLAICKDCLK